MERSIADTIKKKSYNGLTNSSLPFLLSPGSSLLPETVEETGDELITTKL